MGRSLRNYLDSVKARDPAPRSRAEILTYPGVWALGLHRVAHGFYRRGLFLPARMVNHFSRLLTAIDIHPGARIGRNLFIDHGFVVIGETAEVGDDVTIYQGATLGGTNPVAGARGKRHPTVGDGAVISLGVAVLGPIEVGAGARVGANAVVTRDVPPGASVVGIPARPVPVRADERAAFTPYATPCSERFDPERQKLELLECELEAIKQRMARLEAELAAVRRTAGTAA